MKWGSLFSGLGGLDIAAERAMGGTTVWQLDQVLADVRRRHWPDALQVEADVTTVNPLDLPAIDGLCGGFPCTDLSVAGQGAGLDGKKSGLYSEMLRFAGALRPGVVVIENVPALLNYRRRLETDWGALGYGLTFVRARALDAGAPHLRRRVFVLAQAGGRHQGVLEAPRGGVWTPDEDGLRSWPTTTSTDVKASGAEGYSTASGRHSGTTLTDAVRPWATVKTADAASPDPASGDGARQGSDGLACEVRAWPTVAARDYKTGELPNRVGSESLSAAGGAASLGQFGRRLSPDWTECLQGFPPGWTNPTGPRMHVERDPRWPRGRYPKGWDRSVEWPGYDWEPARTIPDGKPVKGRPARIRAVGNSVSPQQGALAITRALRGPEQIPLL